jgi:hypothetical protein
MKMNNKNINRKNSLIMLFVGLFMTLIGLIEYINNGGIVNLYVLFAGLLVLGTSIYLAFASKK